MKKIIVRGARTHNLKNIDIEIPRDQLVVITGLSGSGKSSLAFDTLYAEGQRRYVESLSTYARQFLSIMAKPDIDHIEGLSPAISIEQKATSHNPRSTVGTTTEIYDYLRLLFARAGEPRCPEHNRTLQAQTISQMVDQVMTLPNDKKFMLLAPVVQNKKGEHLLLLNELRAQGFIRARVNGIIVDLDISPLLDKNKKHSIDVVIDRFSIRENLQLRLSESFETCLNLSDGIAKVVAMDTHDTLELLFSSLFACPVCGHSMEKLEPRIFSFNNPAGACGECDGLGVNQVFDQNRVINQSHLKIAEGAIHGWGRRNPYHFQMLISVTEHYNETIDQPFCDLSPQLQQIILHGSADEKINFKHLSEEGILITKKYAFEGVMPNLFRRYKNTESRMVKDDLSKLLSKRNCSTCNGSRLKLESRNVFIADNNLPSICRLSVGQALKYFEELKLTGRKQEIADRIIKEIKQRLSFLVNVGLEYLTIDRSAETLSGGEAQRIRLASQVGAGLVGVMYVLDEPSIGLHQRDNERLLDTLLHLRDLGNSVIVVEHDEETIRTADHIIDVGPGAGVHGGNIVAQGTPESILNCTQSITAQYLSGKKFIAVPKIRHTANPEKMLVITEANGNNLKSVTVNIPIGLITCITGVSGSGKSTLINSTLYPIAASLLNKASTLKAAPYKQITGLEYLDKVVDIDQSPIGRTPRSNPATYTGLFTPIRELFAATHEARSRGYKPGRFSFNVKGGRCEECQGDGMIKVEMHFLPDIYVSCDACKGKRYDRKTLEIKYKGKNIDQILEMTVEEALTFYNAIPVMTRKLQTLMDVGLSYIHLGQAATTLSGGEAQRIKLAKELSKRDTGKTLYILDEPTTGLHFHDIEQLLNVLHRLRDRGNTVIIIEHNLDVIKTADWIIDLGPEGGDAGGIIIATGSPEDIAETKISHTGRFLGPLLNRHTA